MPLNFQAEPMVTWASAFSIPSTEPVRARLSNPVSGKDSSILSEPFANYNIIVLDQALKNRSYITFTNTNA